MKKFILAGILGLSLLNPLGHYARCQEIEEPERGPGYGYDADEGRHSGWFLGSDQGVLFFVGDASNFLSLQYFSTIFGGYNIKGIFAPMVRLGQAIGSTNNFNFFETTTFFFIFEGGIRITPIRYKFRPYFVGTAGMYVLDFTNFGFPINDEVNFTYSGGGGLEYSFGRNSIGVGSAYRGFVNNGLNFNGVEVTLNYTFQF